MEKGWADELVDPDDGANIRRKLVQAGTGDDPYALSRVQNLSFPDFQRGSFPEDGDDGWTKNIINLACLSEVTFPTIYQHLEERRESVAERVAVLEDVAAVPAAIAEEGQPLPVQAD